MWSPFGPTQTRLKEISKGRRCCLTIKPLKEGASSLNPLQMTKDFPSFSTSCQGNPKLQLVLHERVKSNFLLVAKKFFFSFLPLQECKMSELNLLGQGGTTTMWLDQIVQRFFVTRLFCERKKARFLDHLHRKRSSLGRFFFISAVETRIDEVKQTNRQRSMNEQQRTQHFSPVFLWKLRYRSGNFPQPPLSFHLCT